jgi:methylglyoxal/glyoxal reductase
MCRSSLFLVEQLRREGKLPPAGELATPLNHHLDAEIANDGPEPTYQLSNGAKIPQLAFGLYNVPADEKGEEIILQAIAAGYRHFDTATIYGNTATLGRALRRSRVPRSEFFLVSKVWNDVIRQGRDSVRASFEKNLVELDFAGNDGALWFDVLYLHWPVPGQFVEAYHELEALHNEGQIRGIGLSNFNIEEYEELVSSGITVPPVVNQFEVSPVMYRPDLVNYFQENKIAVAASKAISRASAFDIQPIKELAHKYAVSPAQIMLRWSLQKSLVPICKTSSSDRMRENRSVYHFSLDEAAMSLLDSLTAEEDVRQRTELESTRKASN